MYPYPTIRIHLFFDFYKGVYCCVRTGGRGKHNLLFGDTFCKAKYEKLRRRKSEGGQKFLPPNPLPFCPPERLDFKIRNSDFRQKMFEHQSKNTALYGVLSRGFGIRLWRKNCWAFAGPLGSNPSLSANFL